MKSLHNMLRINQLPSAHLLLAALTLGTATAALAAEPPPTVAKPKNSVYVKIVLPKKEPAGDKHPVVESWISETLSKKRGRPELRAVTDWVLLPGVGEKVEHLWMATLDGEQWGCPVSGGVEQWTDDGKVKVSIDGWSPVVPDIQGTTLPAEVGSWAIAEVNYGSNHEAFVAIMVSPPQPKKDADAKKKSED